MRKLRKKGITKRNDRQALITNILATALIKRSQNEIFLLRTIFNFVDPSTLWIVKRVSKLWLTLSWPLKKNKFREVIPYAIEHDRQALVDWCLSEGVCTMSSAIYGDSLARYGKHELLGQARKNGFRPDHFTVMAAAKSGSVDTFRLVAGGLKTSIKLEQRHQQPVAVADVWTIENIKAAAQATRIAAKSGFVDILKQVHSTLYPKDLHVYAARGGHLSVLQFLFAASPLDRETADVIIKEASAGGFADVLSWVPLQPFYNGRSSVSSKLSNIASNAVENNKTSVLKWLLRRNYDFGPGIQLQILRTGSLEAIQLLFQAGQLDLRERDACNYAAERNNFKVVKWAYEMGCKKIDQVEQWSLRNENQVMLQWVRERLIM